MVRSARVVRTGRLEGACARARADSVPPKVVDEALAAVARKFTARDRGGARAEAYFWGVVRKRAVTGGAPSVCARLLVASLASEMREAGHRPEAVFAELRRVYGSEVPGEVLESYRPATAPGQAA